MNPPDFDRDRDRNLSPASDPWVATDPFMADLFFTESEEIVQSLERDLLALEQAAGGEVGKRFRQLLRATHSLKGSAWMYELGEVAEAAHHLETSVSHHQPLWTSAAQSQRYQWLSQWLQVVDGLHQVLQSSRSGAPDSPEQAARLLQMALEALPHSSQSPMDPASATLTAPSLHQTILSDQIPPLLEALFNLCEIPTDIDTIQKIIPDLLEQLQILHGVVQMLKLQDLQHPIAQMETLTAQALITGEQIEELPRLWTEQMIRLETARQQALATLSNAEISAAESPWEAGSEQQHSPADRPPSGHQSNPKPALDLEDPDGNGLELSYREDLGLVSKVDARRVNALVSLVEELVIQKAVLDHHRQELSRLTRGAKQILKGMRHSRQQLRLSTDHLEVAGSADLQARADLDGLEWDRYSQLHEAAYELLEQAAQLQETIEDLSQLERTFDHMGDQWGRLCGDLSEHSSRLRLAPFSQAVDHLPRAMRELSQSYGKSVDLVLYGRNVELDAQVLSQLRDPLSHLVRNAFDHGIEDPQERQGAGKPAMGQIEIEARHRGNHMVITIRDDGRGIDPNRIRRKVVQMGYCSQSQAQAMTEAELYRFLFKPGFSTAEQISALSGRGVGLDIVEAVVTQLQGQISLQSQLGQGTCFTLRFPLTLSLLPALLVRADRDVVAIPQEQILQILRLPLEMATGSSLSWQGQTLPLLKLPELLSYRVPSLEAAWLNPLTVEKYRLPVLILQNLQGERVAGLAVDQLLDHQELIVKPLPSLLPKPVGIRGAAVLGTGRVTVVLDTEELISQAVTGQGRGRGSQPEPSWGSRGKVLVVDDSYSVRQMLAVTLRRQGYQVDQAPDGQAAIAQLAADCEYQAIITDLEMPRLDGLGLLRHLQSQPQLAQIPAIVLTSRSAEKHRAQAQSLRAAVYLTKPFRRQDLLHTLDLLLQPESWLGPLE